MISKLFKRPFWLLVVVTGILVVVVAAFVIARERNGYRSKVATLRSRAIEIRYGAEDTVGSASWSQWLKNEYGDHPYLARCEGKPLNKDTLERIGQLHSLVAVELKSCDLDDDDLQFIRTLSRLGEIDVSGNPITNEGLEHLSGLPRLSVVNVQDTSITPDGIRRFQELHPRIRVISDSQPSGAETPPREKE